MFKIGDWSKIGVLIKVLQQLFSSSFLWVSVGMFDCKYGSDISKSYV
jgi:hypothetical protein